MMYDPVLVQPMRDEVTNLGMKEYRTAEEMEKELTSAGTAFVFVNSVCGCAAGGARPALKLALTHQKKPDRMVTALAGNDKDAVAKARSFFTGFPPSSPQMAILKDGKLVWMMERWQIEGRPPEAIAQDIIRAFDSL
ncbi:MAG TPA: BrxA/BrxB family bacilliredoxin [Candidatus Kapabacteria bacterium]|nr:BrxA/BrxB family bacilliredoxin [Candidatus Kapabacteria bacterium]